MPELPEVEVVRAGLERHVVGATIAAVEVLHDRPVRRHPTGASGFAAALTGRRIAGARRRGKYLWLPLDDGDAILGHLGMSGQMLVQPTSAPVERHLRVRFALTGTDPRTGQGRELRFVDQRMFGGLSVSVGGAGLPPEIAHIARDPLDPEFDDAAFVARLRTRTSGVKRLLLDQGLISGVGNIYADEALWRARLHGERPGNRLTRAQAVELLGHARAVMNEALAQGGTSFDALYVNVNGESGYFDRSLHAYGREAEPCDRCGTPIRRVAFMNRSSYFCPRCQSAPRSVRATRTGSA
ncbi:bifunctional DNA-formamidopyrimidine glycosylase/DNA-(apurinic or apyrimidinic site) lyase [Nocardioides carbamazepini]|jgi:formamidopyrimidine-DNA glycosylase|uniref:bifunctional DNA-formamidopyrimidine glycosylase/DNA-(apurinic or apyrimidinic site) lyase n=1 Tax=Nocardioides carbamazepini TaxID=2854259 RepID=UPI00214A7188|nr:bifunctional DNA-formamidopyrimidine glycosylase/DNA-(apurinic or apyrimidinic site) lyase [Nocardioides carbamazepini]MCR1782518.1 bifunctional DNA-formamidopyrimidine glycosylase/DNA-(apurinic or apyrimidinic site) lyase [Nocardioides carbamazepini]